MILIRNEEAADYAAVYEVNREAFGRCNEADLVDVLRRVADPQISLVATWEGEVVGHIFFSPVSIGEGDSTTLALGLGPMAVDPDFQRRGVGSALVRAGLEACRRAGHKIVVVIGHPNFYPRFGFVSARRRGLGCEYAVPDEVFMVAELEPNALAGVSGMVRYLPEFTEV